MYLLLDDAELEEELKTHTQNYQAPYNKVKNAIFLIKAHIVAEIEEQAEAKSYTFSPPAQKQQTGMKLQGFMYEYYI